MIKRSDLNYWFEAHCYACNRLFYKSDDLYKVVRRCERHSLNKDHRTAIRLGCNLFSPGGLHNGPSGNDYNGLDFGNNDAIAKRETIEMLFSEHGIIISTHSFQVEYNEGPHEMCTIIIPFKSPQEHT